MASKSKVVQIPSPLSFLEEQFHIDLNEVGVITALGDGIAKSNGLYNCAYGEKLILGDKQLVGMVLTLEPRVVSIIIFGHDRDLKAGETVWRTKKLVCIPFYPGLIGHTIDGLGNLVNIETMVRIKNSNVKKIEFPVDVKAMGIITRKPIHEPMQTGIKVVDSLTPIGMGQRELIIGDKKTGKTAIAVDSILNQTSNGSMHCLYVGIGQRRAYIARLYTFLRLRGSMSQSVLMSASSSDAASLQYLAPYGSCTLGEILAKNSQEALIVYDDLSKQAVSYRQISLLLRRPPGREAYPGDIFYLHSRLLERAMKLNEDFGLGSLTALPIVETQSGDVSAYIPTNVISITDGQIFLETELFNRGIRPAVNVGLSVSRIGSAAQVAAIKEIASSLKLELAQYREVQAFSSFAADIDESTLFTLNRGERLIELLKQQNNKPLRIEDQITCIYAGIGGFLDNLAVTVIENFKKYLLVSIYTTNLMLEFNPLEKLNKKIFDSALSYVSKNYYPEKFSI